MSEVKSHASTFLGQRWWNKQSRCCGLSVGKEPTCIRNNSLVLYHIRGTSPLFPGGTQCDGHAELGKAWRGPDAGFRLPDPAPGWTQCPVSLVTVPLLRSDSFKGLYKCSGHTFAGLLNDLSIFTYKVMTVTKWFSPLNRLITQATKATALKEILLHISVMSGCSLPWKGVPTLIFFWGKICLLRGNYITTTKGTTKKKKFFFTFLSFSVI